MNEALQQRRRWFRYFPDGSIEFLLVTRVLGVFLLLALAVMRESQRPMVFLALGIVFLADYVLMMWWGVQTASDLEQLSIRSNDDGPTAGAAEVQRRCTLATTMACLPALVAFVALTPWPGFITGDPHKLAVIQQVLRTVGLVAFAVALFIGFLGLKRIRLGPPVWSLLLLVPILHWFAMHRLVRQFHTRLNECRRVHGHAATDGPSIALPIADVTWALAMLPWAILMVAGMAREAGLSWRDVVTPCGAILTAIFAVADVAAMEGLQRQLGGLLKKIGGQPPGAQP